MNNDIPHFPQQTQLTLEHRDILQDAITKQNIRSADYSLYYLTSWYFNRPAMISRINDRLVLDVEGANQEHIFLGPFGGGPIGPALDTLLKFATEHFKQEPVLRFLPFALANEIQTVATPVKIEEHRDVFDYIYLKEELAELSGRKYQKQRNQLNRITRKYNPDIIVISPQDQEQVFYCVDEWYRKYATDDPLLELEKNSIKRAYPSLFKLGGVGIKIKIDNIFCGLSWALPLTNDTWLVPVEKAAREITGMYQFVNWALANQLPQEVKFLNRESDLGIEGLRIAKERYNPVCFEKKMSFWF